jgi:hypothetical protein
VLVEVRKPGRPLSSCPHPTGSCSCERIVINYTIPKTSECACPSERAPPTATVAGNSRIQKGRRKSAAVNPFSLEKAIKAGLDIDTDTSSITYTPSETSVSNAASLPSSASSTPRLLPAQNDVISSCCKPKPSLSPVQEGGCCSKKAKPAPEPLPKKSCCSGSSNPVNTLPNSQPNGYQHLGHPFQFPAPSQVMIPQYQNFQPQTSPSAPNTFGLGTPIYNHAAAAYHQSNTMPFSPVTNSPMSPHIPGPQAGQHVPEHNCHCGESCSCFGCAAHPNNATMMEYVRVMAHFQYTGGFGEMMPPLYDMPAYPHQAGFGAEVGQSTNFNAMQQSMPVPTPTHMSFQPSMELPNISNASLMMPGNWQQSSASMPVVPQTPYPDHLSYPTPTQVEHHLSPKTEEPAASPSTADSPSSESKEEDTPTLSPSSYFWNQMTLPSCSDATGTCQCGDGCACVGCLTHGGHNGQQLEDTTTAETNAFPDFSTELGLDLNLNDAANFIDFGPT